MTRRRVIDFLYATLSVGLAGVGVYIGGPEGVSLIIFVGVLLAAKIYASRLD